jgi:hypothetical protein
MVKMTVKYDDKKKMMSLVLMCRWEVATGKEVYLSICLFVIYV